MVPAHRASGSRSSPTQKAVDWQVAIDLYTIMKGVPFDPAAVAERDGVRQDRAAGLVTAS